MIPHVFASRKLHKTCFFLSTGLRPPRHHALTGHQHFNFCAEHCCVEHYHHSHDSICYVLLVVFCCSLYPQQVQTRMKQVDKKRFRKQVKMVQNWLEELPKSRLGDSWGPSWPQDSFGQQKWCFWAAPGPSEGTLLEVFSAHVAIQRRPEVENWGFWGGLVAESFFEELLYHFWRGPG